MQGKAVIVPVIDAIPFYKIGEASSQRIFTWKQTWRGVKAKGNDILAEENLEEFLFCFFPFFLSISPQYNINNIFESVISLWLA